MTYDAALDWCADNKPALLAAIDAGDPDAREILDLMSRHTHKYMDEAGEVDVFVDAVERFKAKLEGQATE